jgi:hypothetical protein
MKKDRTKNFPTLAEALVVDCIDDIDNGVAVIIVFRPDGPDPMLASEIPELGARLKTKLSSQLHGEKKCRWMVHEIKHVLMMCSGGVGRCVLFWPTVRAILSGERPGVSLYMVLIFSKRVCVVENK